MAFDESLSKRIEELIKNKKTHLDRKEMFGGVGYLYRGNMCIGVHKNELLVRYDPRSANEINAGKHVRPFDISGRPMKGWSLVSAPGLEGNGLKKWFELSLEFVKTLPEKK